MSTNIECPIGIINNILKNCEECEDLDECMGSLPKIDEKPQMPFKEYRFFKLKIVKDPESFIYIDNNWVPLIVGLNKEGYPNG